jgi:hypothetical protein
MAALAGIAEPGGLGQRQTACVLRDKERLPALGWRIWEVSGSGGRRARGRSSDHPMLCTLASGELLYEQRRRSLSCSLSKEGAAAAGAGWGEWAERASVAAGIGECEDSNGADKWRWQAGGG